MYVHPLPEVRGRGVVSPLTGLLLCLCMYVCMRVCVHVCVSVCHACMCVYCACIQVSASFQQFLMAMFAMQLKCRVMLTQTSLYNVCDLSPCPDSHVCNRELAHTYSSTQLLSLWSCMRIVKPSRSFSSCAENVSISTEGLCCPFGYTGPTCEGTTSIIMLWHHQLRIQYVCYFYVPCLFCSL